MNLQRIYHTLTTARFRSALAGYETDPTISPRVSAVVTIVFISAVSVISIHASGTSWTLSIAISLGGIVAGIAAGALLFWSIEKLIDWRWRHRRRQLMVKHAAKLLALDESCAYLDEECRELDKEASELRASS